jgi:hypothetical protein
MCTCYQWSHSSQMQIFLQKYNFSCWFLSHCMNQLIALIGNCSALQKWRAWIRYLGTISTQQVLIIGCSAPVLLLTKWFREF